VNLYTHVESYAEYYTNQEYGLEWHTKVLYIPQCCHNSAGSNNIMVD